MEGCIVVHKKPLVHCTAWTLNLVYNSLLENFVEIRSGRFDFIGFAYGRRIICSR